MKSILFTFLLLFLILNLSATDYYLSSDGDDANNGTSIATPWKTLSKLSAELGGISGNWGTITEGSRIFFRKGDTFRGTIVFAAWNNNSITFDSYGTGEKPIIKGSTIVSDWTVHSGNIWKANLPAQAYFLYVDGVLQTLARTPDTGYWHVSSATSTSLTCSDIGSSGKNFTGASVCIREYDWRINRQTVASQSANTVNWSTAIAAAGLDANFYFDNKLELLDANGEWYYDVATQTLYLMSSTDPNTLLVEASTNLAGIAGNDNRSNNVIQNLQFEHYADEAIRLMGSANGNSVLNCTFKNNFTPIFVSGANEVVQNNQIEDAYYDGMILANMGNSLVSSNTITNVGVIFGLHRPGYSGDFYSSGIWLINANPVCTISNNTITNCGNNGIRYGGNGIVIEQNYLENILLNMSDGGAIYTWGIDSYNNIVRKNKINNVVGDKNGTSPAGIVNGIYIDNDSYNNQIENNTVENVAVGSGILINAGSHQNTITGNVTYKCQQGVTFSDWLTGQSVYNNTVSGNTFYSNLPEAIPILIASNDNNYTTMTTCNNNFLCNPYSNNVASYIWSVNQQYSLAQWRTSTSYDLASTGSYYSWNFPTDNSFLVSNTTSSPVIYNFTNVVDLNNNPVTSLTLPAYSSKVLINIVTTFTGTGNWSSTGNWSNGMPTSTIDGIIDGNATVDIAAETKSLTINAGKSLTVNDATSLTVNSLFKNNAGPTGLVIESGGSLIHNSPGVAGTVKRLVPGLGSSMDGWHLLSSPVEAQEISGEFTPILPSVYDFYAWDEATSLWINRKNLSSILPIGTAPYFDVVNSGLNFKVGKGYLVAYDAANPTLTFTGTLNTGDKVLSCTKTTGIGEGWNLLGNPFASAIDWTAVTLGAGMDNALYYYDHTVNNYRYYLKLTGENIAIGGGQQYIPAMQGFMVHANTNGATVSLSNAARTHSGQAVFYKSTNSVPASLSLKVSVSGYADEAYIHFNRAATTAFDGGYDAFKLKSYSSNLPSIYTVASDGNQLAINGLPEIEENNEIPVYFEAGTDGQYSITANLQNLPDAHVYLVDIKLSRTQNLSNNPVYSFAASTTDQPNRFKLAFKSVGVNETATQQPINIYSRNNSVYVANSSATSLKGEAYVYNSLGQVMSHQTLNGGLTKINLSSATGYYLVKVITKETSFTGKVFVQ